jgi:hypothetical protein
VSPRGTFLRLMYRYVVKPLASGNMVVVRLSDPSTDEKLLSRCPSPSLIDMNGASSLTSLADGVAGNAMRRVYEHITHRLTVGAVGVFLRPATARQQPLSVMMIQGTTTTTPAEQSSAAWDRGGGSWVRRRRHRCRRERRGRRQQAENNRQAAGKDRLVADDVELHFLEITVVVARTIGRRKKELFSFLYQATQL